MNLRGGRRFFSTKTISKNPVDHQLSLPPARLRAIVSLYHQSADFITHENLSERIDRAFTHPTNTTALSVHESTFFSLSQQVTEIREGNPSSNLLYKGTVLNFKDPPTWSMDVGIAKRDAAICQVLWGIDGNKRPSFETVIEASTSHDKDQTIFEEMAAAIGRRK